MRRIDFVTLKLFVAIADERSLTRAAEREHLALAAVSKRVSDLENQLGIALLYRQPKGVELTPAGHALLHHARNMMDNLEQLNADLSEFSEGVKGHVRIHANTSAVIEFLPEDLASFSRLHPQVKDRLDAIKRIVITTHESAIRIIDKRGPLANPADRDHCIQYMAAIGLIKGSLTAADYEDEAAADPRIDRLRSKTTCVEDRKWSRDYLDPAKRSIANALQVFFNDGSKTEKVVVEYPLGHRRRRREGIPQLEAKFRVNLARRFPPKQQQAILGLCHDARRLAQTPVNEFVDLFCV